MSHSPPNSRFALIFQEYWPNFCFVFKCECKREIAKIGEQKHVCPPQKKSEGLRDRGMAVLWWTGLPFWSAWVPKLPTTNSIKFSYSNMESGKCEMFFNETDGDFGQEYHRRNLPMYQQGCCCRWSAVSKVGYGGSENYWQWPTELGV